MNNSVIIDVVTIIVMCLAVFYAARLNRALSRARDGRSELAQLIVSLTEAHTKAEAAIKNMKTVAAEYDGALQKQIAISRGLAEELMLINESSNALANRMERLAPLARGSFEAAYRAGEADEQAAKQASSGQKGALRAPERPVTSGEGKSRAWPAEAAKKAVPSPAEKPRAEKTEPPRAPVAAPANVRSIAGSGPAGDGEGAPRSRAEQELFAAIETLRKGR